MNSADSSSEHVVVSELDDGALRVRFQDAFLNYATSETLAADVKSLCRSGTARGARRFLVDLTAVTVMDSCGLSMLVAMKRAAEDGGARLVLFGLSPMIRRLFAVTKVERVFDIRDDENAALASFAATA